MRSMDAVHYWVRKTGDVDNGVIMTKTELVNLLAKQQQYLSEKDVSKTTNLILELMGDSLSQGQRVEIRGFGSFSLHHWGERYARNPVTGEAWRTPPVHAVHFKAGKELKDRVNQRFLQEQQQKAAVKQDKDAATKVAVEESAE